MRDGRDANPVERVLLPGRPGAGRETCFARFAENGVGERWQKSMEGLIAGLADETGELVRYEEDWDLD